MSAPALTAEGMARQALSASCWAWAHRVTSSRYVKGYGRIECTCGWQAESVPLGHGGRLIRHHIERMRGERDRHGCDELPGNACPHEHVKRGRLWGCVR